MLKIFKLFVCLIIFTPAFALAATLPELPRLHIDTSVPPVSGKTWAVKTSAEFQDTLDKSQYGDEIVLKTGTDFIGSFILKKKSGSGVILIRSSESAKLPSSGTRIDPNRDEQFMAHIKASEGNAPAITTAKGAQGYYFLGVEVTKSSTKSLTNLILLGNATETSLSDLPSHITFDRVYVHGDTGNLRRCLAFNGAYLAVVDSYISDCHEAGADSQAVAGWNGPGPFKIVNNFLEAAGENVLFGGGDPKINGLIPSDIEIKNNYFYKPLSWKNEKWTVKNLLETKNAARVLIDGNTFENNWVAAQTGTAILFKSTNQDGKCVWCQSKDITFSNNVIKNVTEGIRMNGAEGSPKPALATRILIENSKFENVDTRLFQIFNGVSNVTFDRVTGDADSLILLGDGGSGVTNSNLVIKNSVLRRGKYGVGTGAEEGSAYLNKWFSPVSFENNIIVNTAGEISNDKVKAKYPTGTTVVSSFAEAKVDISPNTKVTPPPVVTPPAQTPSTNTSSSNASSGGDSSNSSSNTNNENVPAPVASTRSSGGGGGSSAPLSNTTNNARSIEELKSQLVMLMTQLAAARGIPQSTSSASTPVNFSSNFSGTSVSQDLTLGSSGSGVVTLQSKLVSQGYLTMPPGVGFGYFGPLTQAALSNYQAAQGISPSVGYFGPITRAHMGM